MQRPHFVWDIHNYFVPWNTLNLIPPLIRFMATAEEKDHIKLDPTRDPRSRMSQSPQRYILNEWWYRLILGKTVRNLRVQLVHYCLCTSFRPSWDYDYNTNWSLVLSVLQNVIPRVYVPWGRTMARICIVYRLSHIKYIPSFFRFHHPHLRNDR